MPPSAESVKGTRFMAKSCDQNLEYRGPYLLVALSLDEEDVSKGALAYLADLVVVIHFEIIK